MSVGIISGSDTRRQHPDLLIAAAVEAAGVAVLQHDEGYDRIAAITWPADTLARSAWLARASTR